MTENNKNTRNIAEIMVAECYYAFCVVYFGVLQIFAHKNCWVSHGSYALFVLKGGKR